MIQEFFQEYAQLIDVIMYGLCIFYLIGYSVRLNNKLKDANRMTSFHKTTSKFYETLCNIYKSQTTCADDLRKEGVSVNLLEHEVLEVLSQPEWGSYESVEWWAVKVRYICYGVEGVTELSFQTPEEAIAVEPGYKWIG